MVVIRGGNTHRNMTCPECNAELRYSGVDVHYTKSSTYIVCGDCGAQIEVEPLRKQKKTLLKKVTEKNN